MYKILMVLTSLMMSIASHATDIYGVSDRDIQNIMKKHGKEIAELEMAVQKEIQNTPISDEDNNQPDSPSFIDLKKKKKALIEQLTQENGFLFVELQVVLYPDLKNKPYITLEIIDKKHPERLRFITPKQKMASKNEKAHKPDLIEAREKYETTAFKLIIANKLGPISPCPVYHCTLGFDHSQLKPYLAIFNKGAVKQKALILNTLKSDPSQERRASAAFLVGHFSDPHEIIALLSPYITDQNDGVRNNAMRVIGRTMEKAKIYDVNITPVLEVLSSPYESDRNKALVILLSAAQSDAVKKQILQKSGDDLVAMLRLQQPNNHDWAYKLLKKISGKDFGGTNVAAWGKWVSSAQKQLS